jgi:hypothetical protein
MKRLFALLFVSCFMFAACSNGSGGGGSGGGATVTQPTMDVTVSGTFSGDKTGSFTATTGAAVASVAAATPMAAGEYLLTGLLEDGTVTFRLAGTYNSIDKTYTLSAGTDYLVYKIDGALNDSGAATTATVELSINDQPDGSGTWTTTLLSSSNIGQAQNISDSNVTESKGLPAKWLGRWVVSFSDTDEDGYHYTYNSNVSVSPFLIKEKYNISYDGGNDIGDEEYSILKVTGSGDVYEMILSYDCSGFTPALPTPSTCYDKYKLTQHSPTQVLLQYYGDDQWYTAVSQIPNQLDSGTILNR